MLDYLITEDELCARLGKSKSALQAWRHRGQGPAWVKLGGRIYFDTRKIDAWIQAQERVPEQAAA